MACKRPGPRVEFIHPGGVHESGSTVHPAGCMGARQWHLDADPPPGDPCGLLEALHRGGHRLPARVVGDCVEVNLEGLGVPCVIRVCPAPRWLRSPRVYVMATRSSKIYLAAAGRKR